MNAYPLKLSFKLIAVSPQVKITDAQDRLILYVRQKALALKEDVKVFADEAQQQQLYQIKADRIIDWSAAYTVTRPDGSQVGAIRRQGRKSLWRATYQILDSVGNEVGLMHEETPWKKLVDGLVPFAGYFVNPAYLIDLHGQTMLYLKKERSLVEGRFTLEQRGAVTDADETLLLPSLIMMLMLERARG
ncbi:hypothetical protein BH20CHL6_BH20CHL6_04220 [soil metagenome]